MNLKSVWLLSQAAGQHMVPLRRGKIVNFCSLLTFQVGARFHFPYLHSTYTCAHVLVYVLFYASHLASHANLTSPMQGGLTVPAYAAAKGALGQLTKALSNEWSASNVQVGFAFVCVGVSVSRYSRYSVVSLRYFVISCFSFLYRYFVICFVALCETDELTTARR